MPDRANLTVAAFLTFFAALAMIRTAAYGVGYPSETAPTFCRSDSEETNPDPVFEHSRPMDPAEIDSAKVGAFATSWLADSYPQRIAERALRNGVWSLRIGEQWFAWADGRLLPEEKQDRVDDYSPIRFYDYRLGEHEVPDYDEEFVRSLRMRYTGDGSADEIWLERGRHQAFYEALYGVESLQQADRKMQRTTFLGYGTRVHPMLVEPLRNVESDIYAAASDDASVSVFVENIRQVSGFFWRDIFGSASRSYHSYGAAIDLLPRTWRGGFGYWRWALQSGIEDWWSLPLHSRFHVPQPIVDAFERHGFVWGGKWVGFDPIHFEYRPEVIRYAGERRSPGDSGLRLY